MKDLRWQILIGVILVTLSMALYILHFFLFHDAYHIWIYLIGDIAFLPIEVLLVTLVIHQLLESRDRRLKLEKMNMVVGAFFNTAGTRLMATLARNDRELRSIQESLLIRDTWTPADFSKVNACLRDHRCSVDVSRLDLQAFKEFLMQKEDFIVRLLENPLILEHEIFTDLIMAVSHLTSELAARETLTNLPEPDLQHLALDMNRVYERLVIQWLEYMQYLKVYYPYLFSLAMRTNPFDEHATAIIS